MSVSAAPWPIVPLGELCAFRNGVNADRHAYGQGIPFINVLEVIRHPYLRAAQIPGRVSLPDDVIRSFLVEKGDIVINRSSETLEEVGLASVYLDDEPVVFGGFVIRGKLKDRRLIPQYAGYGLRARAVRNAIIARGQGAIRANIGQHLLADVGVPLPPEREQVAIAEALADADALIESLEQRIAKKHLIKQGVMQELLTGKRRLPGFAGEWGKVTFGQAFDFLPTATNPRSDLTAVGDYFYIHYGDLHTKFESHLDFSTASLPCIDQALVGNAALIKNGDWIIADASEDYDGVGKSVEVVGLDAPKMAVAGLHTFLLRDRAGFFAPGFKGHLGGLHSLHQEFLRVATGMKVYGVSKSALRELTLPMPPIEEQKAIAEVLSAMDAELVTLATQVDKARLLKHGMTQQLLTGRIRLV